MQDFVSTQESNAVRGARTPLFKEEIWEQFLPLFGERLFLEGERAPLI